MAAKLGSCVPFYYNNEEQRKKFEKKKKQVDVKHKKKIFNSASGWPPSTEMKEFVLGKSLSSMHTPATPLFFLLFGNEQDFYIALQNLEHFFCLRLIIFFFEGVFVKRLCCVCVCCFFFLPLFQFFN